jgi:carbon-monoxide dehydrogenase small subunit
MITVNGINYYDYDPERKLSLWLREDLSLTGTKIGCDIGVCGSCTILINGEPKLSCPLKVKDVENCNIITIEGVALPDGTLHPIQQAFIDAGAIQCGFCTPGMVLTAYALLKKNPHPTRQQVRQAIRGNLCRCTGYQQIIDAIMLAAERLDLKQP